MTLIVSNNIHDTHLTDLSVKICDQSTFCLKINRFFLRENRKIIVFIVNVVMKCFELALIPYFFRASMRTIKNEGNQLNGEISCCLFTYYYCYSCRNGAEQQKKQRQNKTKHHTRCICVLFYICYYL